MMPAAYTLAVNGASKKKRRKVRRIHATISGGARDGKPAPTCRGINRVALVEAK